MNTRSGTEIGDAAFCYCRALKTISIPDGTEIVSSGCFEYCSSLEEITLPESIVKIESDAFKGCTVLEEISISNVIEIGAEAFVSCKAFTHFTFPDKVVSVGHSVFGYCDNLETVTIPESITNIGDTPFYSCRKLKNITVDKDNKNYCSEDGVLYNREKTVLICYPAAKIDPYVIPDTVTILRTQCLDGFFRDKICIPKSVIDMEGDAIPFGEFTDVYYGGSEEDWNNIKNGGNVPLLYATMHYNCSSIWPFTDTVMTSVGDVTEFTVTATDNVPQSSQVLLVCYKNGRFIKIQCREYTGSVMTFTTDEDFDCVKVLVWDDVKNMAPICGGENLYK